MAAHARRPPLVLRLLEPVVTRLGFRIAPAGDATHGPPAPRSRISSVRRALLERRGWTIDRPYPRDFDESLVTIIERVSPFTITSRERVAGMVASVEHAARTGLPGAIVECGVWRGGSMMAAALALLDLGVDDRELYLFDTFDGMTEPTAADVAVSGEHTASDMLDDINAWCRVGLDEVRSNLLSTGYPAARIHLVEGKVEETLPANAPEEIAVLRLDTDWYASTAHEMRHLYPRLCSGGILLVDDYGAWSGARRAVDEYFGAKPPFLHRVDDEARLIVKL